VTSGVNSWTLSGQFVRNTDRAQETANKGSASLRYDYEPSARFFLYGRFGASYNRPAGLDRRLAPGVGLGYDVLSGDTYRVALGGGWNWIEDRFADASRTQAVYFTVSQDFDLKVNSDTELSQSLAYLPRPGSLEDYLVHGEVTLLTSFWKWFGIKLSFIDDFDSTPFVDPETGQARAKNDITFITGLNLQF
jgi:putative salt-induced outer membrane protein YdiY